MTIDKQKRVITYSEFKKIMDSDGSTEASNQNRAVNTSVFVLISESQLSKEILSNLKGISKKQVKKVFTNSEIIGANKKKFYCANAGFLLDVILKSK